MNSFTPHSTTGCGHMCIYLLGSSALTCSPDNTTTWQAMVKPLVDKVQVSLMDLLQRSYDVMTIIDSLLYYGTFDFVLNPGHLAPLLPYMASDCEWCMSSQQPLVDLLSSKLKDSISKKISSTIQKISNMTEPLNSYMTKVLFHDSITR